MVPGANLSRCLILLRFKNSRHQIFHTRSVGVGLLLVGRVIGFVLVDDEVFVVEIVVEGAIQVLLAGRRVGEHPEDEEAFIDSRVVFFPQVHDASIADILNKHLRPF